MIVRRILPFICIGFITIAVSGALEIDRAELQDVGDADIEFENYQGPVEQIDSREAIRGIGRDLGDSVTASGRGNYGGRYRATRILGDPESSLRGADIIELDGAARVDHIVNLRRIVAGYLESAWQYQREDADLLARFITIYNAVHRGNMSFFASRYRSAVVDFLQPERAGLATSYRQWPGNTQLVIPIRDDRVAGDLDVVDSRQLIDRDVIAELRSRADLGIEDRKAIIAFIERVIEERTEAIAEERAEIDREQAEIDRRREDEETADSPEPAEEPAEEPEDDDTSQPPEEDAAETDTTEAAVAEDDRQDESIAESPAEADSSEEEEDEEEDDEEDLDQREAELQERREELDREEEEVRELTEEVEELYQETAEDQVARDAGIEGRERIPFVLSGNDGSLELAVVDLETLEPAGEQTIPLATREVVRYQGALLAAHAGSGRLLLLEETSLEILEESDVRVIPGGRVRIVDQSVMAVISEGGEYYIGQFDAQLVLQRRSAEAVRMTTDIVHRDDDLVVQGADGTLRRLDLREFR
jgi:uncharacterized coiled-coil protein SlyX